MKLQMVTTFSHLKRIRVCRSDLTIIPMASFNSTETGNTEVQDDTKQWGQTILRAKTALIKPYSKVKLKFNNLLK
jgi:hypothetical protein